MASSLLLKRLASSTLLSWSFSRTITTTATSASHFCNINATRQYDNKFNDCDLDVDHCFASRRHYIFSDVFDPFSPTRSLSQVLNLMNQMTKNPFFARTRDRMRRGWDVKKDKNTLNLRINMLGLGKENVKVLVELNTLGIKGEGAKESDDEKSVRRYMRRIDLPEKMYKTSEIKAKMRNGVLKMVVPKV